MDLHWWHNIGRLISMSQHKLLCCEGCRRNNFFTILDFLFIFVQLQFVRTDLLAWTIIVFRYTIQLCHTCLQNIICSKVSGFDLTPHKSESIKQTQNPKHLKASLKHFLVLNVFYCVEEFQENRWETELSSYNHESLSLMLECNNECPLL